MAKRVALVTGGTRGIGRAIAMRLLGDEWDVVICARTPPEKPVISSGRSAHFLDADLRDADAVEMLMAQLLDRTGRLDLVVNNAGGSPALDLAASPASLIEKIVALNLVAPLLLARAAYPALRKAGGGSLVNIASISGRRAAPGTTAYGAAKAGLINATSGLAMEWAPDVRVNAIVLGLVENPDQIEHYGGAEGIARISAGVPMKRLARGEDVAACVAWLASPEASYVTGSAIDLHGGGEIPAFLALARDEAARGGGA